MPSRAIELYGACLVLLLTLPTILPLCLALTLSDGIRPLEVYRAICSQAKWSYMVMLLCLVFFLCSLL